ncbi:THOC3 isoform 10, partial [Pan troglodytes]
HDGKMLASASEDHFIDIAEVETVQQTHSASQKAAGPLAKRPVCSSVIIPPSLLPFES